MPDPFNDSKTPIDNSSTQQAAPLEETEQPRKKSAGTWAIVLAAIAFFIWKQPEAAQAIVIFVITLSILVFVHEWGHYQFARWAGMKVNRFGIGFPPWIYTKRKNGIDYSIGALPIGGMVDIAGLGSEEEMVATTKGAAAKSAQASDGVTTATTNVEGVWADDPNPKPVLSSYMPRRPDRPHGEKNFQDASLGWRFLTLFAGPLMNFIFALTVFAIMFSLIGVPADKSVNNKVDFVYPGAPADRAGIEAGDRLIAVGGVRSNETSKLRELIRAGNGKPVTVTVERKGQELQRSLTPQIEDELQADGFSTKKAAIIGVMFTRVTEYHRVGLLRGDNGFWDSAVGYGLRGSYELADRIFALLRRVVTLRMTADDKRNIGGPVKIAQTINHTAKKSWQETILVAAALSVNLGLMNLLPIPALDGGRIMFLGYELIARRPVDARRETMVNAVGMVMVLTFMLFMTLRDVLPMLRIKG